MTQLKKSTGLTKQQIIDKLNAADAAVKAGKPWQDPFLYSQVNAMFEASHEVTTPFGRQGVNSREINKSALFFAAAVAGIGKQVRNIKNNPKLAALCIGLTMALRTMYWLLYSDEEWYKELSPSDRYQSFVVPFGGNLYRLPAPRDLDVPVAGGWAFALDAANGKNPRFKDLARATWDANTPPAPVPTVAKTGAEIALNENWQGRPIVPGRDEKLPELEKWKEYKGPYAAEQLTGGIVRAPKIPDGPADLSPYSKAKPRQSVDDFYSEFRVLEGERLLAQRKGLKYADESRYKKYEAAQRKIQALTREARGERLDGGKMVKMKEPPTAERKEQIRVEQTRIAREVLGR